MEREENILLLCKCSNTEHQLIFNYIEDDSEPEVYVSVHLVKEPNILKRFWRGLKYIFGYTSKYGDFDEIILKPNDYEKLQKVTDYLKKSYGLENRILLKD